MRTFHVTDLEETTPATRQLSQDFLDVLKQAVSSHTGTIQRQNARNLLEDDVDGVNGKALIRQGLGIELYQQRVKRAFYSGLGLETIEALEAFTSSVQQSGESVGAFFTRQDTLYEQVQRMDGCDIGPTARKAFALHGLQKGAYHEVLEPWVAKIMLGQGRLKLRTASLSDLQHSATDILRTSTKYTKNNVLQPGCLPGAAARAATTDSQTDAPTTDGDNTQLSHFGWRLL